MEKQLPYFVFGDTPYADKNGDFTWLESVPEGWQPRFLEMCDQIAQYLQENNYKTPYSRFVIDYIKEKFGELDMMSHFENVQPDDIRAMEIIIREAEKDTARICFVCGKPATLTTKGWIAPFCEECAKAQIKKDSEHNHGEFKFEDVFEPLNS